MKAALIVNPQAGRCRLKALLPALKEGLRRRGIRHDLHLPRSTAEAAALIRRLPLDAYDTVATAGGDGTNYQLLNTLLRSDPQRRLPPLGIIPAGRGNSFARDLGLFSLEDGLDALAGGLLQAVDVCRFTQPDGPQYFVNLMGLGFVTDVAVTAARLPWLGDAGYAVGVFHRVLGLRRHRLVLDIDGQRIDADNCFVEICNSRYTGGAMCMAPEARLDDGLFDVVLLAPVGRLKLVASFPKIYNGTHGRLGKSAFCAAARPGCSPRRPRSCCPTARCSAPPPPTWTSCPGGWHIFVCRKAVPDSLAFSLPERRHRQQATAILGERDARTLSPGRRAFSRGTLIRGCSRRGLSGHFFWRTTTFGTVAWRDKASIRKLFGQSTAGSRASRGAPRPESFSGAG